MTLEDRKENAPEPSVTFQGLDIKVWKIIAVVLLGPFMTQMDSTVVNISLAAIRQDLNSTIATTQWIISGYLLALALMLPLNGWIVDRLGAKKLYVGCFTAFTLTSVLCGAAHTMEQLIFARVLQGMAGGLLAPLTQMMMAKAAGNQLARAIGYAAAPILIAPTIGPIIAGAILKYAGWPWLFYINLPFGIIAIVLAAYLLPRDEELPEKRPFDRLGFILISPGLVCLLYGFEQASHKKGTSILITGILLLIAFVWHARRAKTKALVDLELFRNRIFSAAALTQFLSNGILYAGQFLIPLYLMTGCGLTAGQVGWMLAPMGIGMMCVYPMIGYLTERFGCRAVAVTGIGVNVLATLPFVYMIHAGVSPVWLITTCLLLRGAGQGATGIPTIAAAYSSVAKNKLGLAATAINIVQRLGGPMATTLIAITVSLSTNSLPLSTPHGFLIPFIALILIQTLLFGSAIRLPARVPQRQ